MDDERAAPKETRSASGAAPQGRVLLVREEPLLLELGDDRLLTMRTPGDDEDLALGFLLTERVIAAARDVRALAARRDGDADVIAIELEAGASAIGRGRLSRAHEIRPSCGICGAASAEGLTRDLARLAPGRPKTTIGRLKEFERALRAEQRLFAATGGAHAAALFDVETGALLALKEDVGRHNAVDKAVGRAARDGRDLARAALVLSGRGGFELVLKALRVGIPIVASVSAPTSLAVEIAESAGATLVGFLRSDGLPRVYADDGRII